jgi:hypothetical protein
MDKKTRKKSEILDTLPDVITEGDKSFVKSMYHCSGSLLLNEYQSDDNPATYVGWLKTDSGDIVRIEGETRVNEKGKINLALKNVTVPRGTAEAIGLEEQSFRPSVTGEKDSQIDFFHQ